METDKLAPLRAKIDALDEKLIRLLNERARLGMKIAGVKAQTGAPVFMPGREQQILQRIAGRNQGPLATESLAHIFREIFSATRAVEKPLTITCLGPEGSFSHLAARRLFGSSAEHLLAAGIDMVFQNVERGVADFGVVPIENTIEGAVGQTMDLLLDSPARIFAETYYEIHLNLLSNEKSMAGVTTLYTHYMPLGQCRGWVGRNLPGVKIIETNSTAEAAKLAHGQQGAAAIAAFEAATLYGLDVLAEKIEERHGNQTRFLAIAMRDCPKSGDDKTSILFSTKDQAGALQRVLKPFSDEKLNLSRIQSRPNPSGQWEYVFFVDFDGHKDSPAARRALNKVRKQTESFKVLGSYPNGRA